MGSLIVNLFGIYCVIFCTTKVNSHCQAQTEDGYQWPKTQIGKRAMVECSSSGSTNLEGTIDRLCDTNGWEDLDLTNCINPMFGIVEGQLENLNINDPGSISTTNGAMLTSALLTATTPPNNAIGPFISPANLNCAVDSLRLIQKSIKLKNQVNRDEALDRFGNDWFKTFSNVLDSRNLKSYMSKSVDVMSLTNTLVDSLDGIAPDYGLYSSTEKMIIEQNLYVIGGPIENPSEEGLAVFPTSPTPDGERIKMSAETINYLKSAIGISEVRIGMTVSEELGRIIKVALNTGEDGARPSSKFVTLGVGGQQEKLQLISPVRIEFKQSAADIALVNSGASIQNCGYWNTKKGLWSMDGLTGVKDSPDHFACLTSHLTSFSVLINPNPIGNDTSITEQLALSIVTYILCVVSLIALIVSIIILLLLGKELFKKDLYMVHLNFAIALSISLLFFIFGVQTARDNVIACGIIAGILHYTFLSVFSWSLCEAILVLYMLYVLFSPRRIYPYLMVLGWGLPIPVVAITVGIRWNNYGVEGQYCWLSTENGTVWSFVGPALTVVFINIFLLVIAVARILTALKAKMQEMTRFRQARTVAFGTFVLVPILGIPWIVAVLNFFVSVSLFQWIFVILNTPQGLMFFLLYIANNRDLLRKVRRKKHVSQKESQLTQKESGSVYSSKISVMQQFKKQSSSSIGTSDVFVPESQRKESIPELLEPEDTNSKKGDTDEQLGIKNTNVSLD